MIDITATLNEAQAELHAHAKEMLRQFQSAVAIGEEDLKTLIAKVEHALGIAQPEPVVQVAVAADPTPEADPVPAADAQPAADPTPEVARDIGIEQHDAAIV